MADLQKWEPENEAFWESQGKKIAQRNLWISIPSLLCGFAVWLYWGILTVQMMNAGFKFAAEELFTLTAIAGLSGATLRIPSSFFIRFCGGRNTIFFTTSLLLIPAFFTGLALQDPTTPLWQYQLLALLSGFGGGNFASSMSNISFFYPKAQQGTALGLNAGLGNLGVSVMQFLVPLVIGFSLFGAVGGRPQELADGGQLWLQNAGFVWVPLIIAVTVAAWFCMNDLTSAKASFSEQAVIFTRKHNWLMCWLYLATFGSFIGFAAGSPFNLTSRIFGSNQQLRCFGAQAGKVGSFGAG